MEEVDLFYLHIEIISKKYIVILTLSYTPLNDLKKYEKNKND